MKRVLILTMRFIGVLLAMAATLWLSAPANAVEPDLKQETLEYCIARGQLALDITRAMEQGYTIDQINIGWEHQSESEEMAAGREEWVDALKVEIDNAAKDIPRDKDEWAQRVAQKIIEKCWYDYGKRRVEKQSALPHQFVRTASSEAIAKPSRMQECSELLVDQIYIGNMLGSHRASVDELRTLALQSEQGLGQERFQKVLGLIDEAETAVKKEGGIQSWFDAYWHACTDGAR